MRNKLLLAIILALPNFVFAYDAEIDGIYYNFSGTEAIVTSENDDTNEGVHGGNGGYTFVASYVGNVVIPSTITYNNRTYTVTTIYDNAFRNCTELTSIVIPYSVVTMGLDVFTDCTQLKLVSIHRLYVPERQDSGGGIIKWLDKHSEPCSLSEIFGEQVETYMLGKEIENISYTDFVGCTQLASIVIEEGNQKYDSRNNGNAIIDSKTNELVVGCKGTNIPNTVTSIGISAFQGCIGLVSINIPNSVETIDGHAFSGCNGLPIEGNLRYAGTYLVEAADKTQTNYIIKEGTKWIGSNSFYGCNNLTSLTIPKSVTSIGSDAFAECDNMTYVAFMQDKNVDTTRFAGISGIQDKTQIIVPYNSLNVWRQEFAGQNFISLCKGIRSTKNSATLNISETLPDSFSDAKMIASINGQDFERKGDSVVITNLRPNTTYRVALSAVMEGNTIQDTIEFQTDKGLALTATVQTTTQTTATIAATCETFGEEVLSEAFDGKAVHNGTLTLSGLIPGTTYTKIYVVITQRGEKDSIDVTFTTKDIVVGLEGTSSATSVSLVGSFDAGDAGVSESGFEGYSDNGELIVSGLEPETEYSFTFYVRSRDGGKTFNKTIQISTQPIELDVLTPRVVSSGNVVVAAESNITDEESNVGFEWRRTDWYDDIDSKRGTAFLYQGTIEGYIHDLYIHQLWRVRPYYRSNSNNYYYGKWVNFDPSDVSYFEPTVHTYSYVEVEGNGARVKGYVMNGSDKVKEQGFKYWKKTGKTSSPLYPQATEVPDDAMTVNVDVSSQSLNATLPNLQENMEYGYVAFVTTDKGETYYGEEQSFSVDDPSGVVSAYMENLPDNVVKVCTLSGKIVYTGPEQGFNPNKGMYIFRYPNGKSKKVVY